jgi:hypothetical protein
MATIMSSSEELYRKYNPMSNNFPVQTFNEGVMEERARFIKLLKELRVIRDNIFWENVQVIYTEDGPIDISWSRLNGE